MFRRFTKSYQGADAIKMKKWAHVEMDGCNFALKETAGGSNLKLVHLGKEVNSNYADQAPAYRDDVLYFASIHSDTVLWMNKDMSDAKKDGMLMKLYTSKVTGDSYEPANVLKHSTRRANTFPMARLAMMAQNFSIPFAMGDCLNPIATYI